MLTKGKIQTLKSYTDKKERNKKNIFIVEGEKSVVELLYSDIVIQELFITHEFAKKHSVALKECEKRHAALQKWIKPNMVEAGELNAISSMERVKSECNAFAVATQIAVQDMTTEEITAYATEHRVLMLDDIRDPGNLGTLIRIADWYGIKTIIASIGTVDIYNPKTIAASMGSFSRIQVLYKNIYDVIQHSSKHKIPCIASTLKGENANAFTWPTHGILVIGNEANGIANELLRSIKNQITLPSFGKAESLNAAIACGILLDRWTR